MKKASWFDFMKLSNMFDVNSCIPYNLLDELEVSFSFGTLRIN